MKKPVFTCPLFSSYKSHYVCGVCVCVCVQSLSRVWLVVTSRIVARRAPVSMQFLRQKSGTEPMSFALAGGFFTTEPPGKLRSSRSSSSSVAQSCPTLCDPMNRSTPGLPVHHQLPEFTQTHVHRVSDAIQPSHPLSSPSHPAPNPSQHQSLFQWVNSSHEVAKVLEFQL